MNTPYFLISENGLKNNINAFKEALYKYWPNSEIAFSIKTNSLPWLLKYFKEQQIIVEAVSMEEYKLAEMCGFSGKEIVFNGPIKKNDDLEIAFNNDSIINLDSQSDLNYLIEKKPYQNGNIGVRVNVNTDIFNSEDIGYVEDGFRFGYAYENGEFEKVIKTIRKIYGDVRIGLHLHCNSVTRSVDVYRKLSQYATRLISEYDLKVSFIDIGGGFFGGVEGKPMPEEYIYTISEELKNIVDINETKFLIEPGSAIIGSVVDLYTSVIDVKQTTKANIVTTDGSRIQIDPLWKKQSYLYSIETSEERPTVNRQIVCGYTCMDHDRIMAVENEKQFNIGDKIIYHRVGAYTMTFGGPFIQYFPDVYVQSENKIELVRKRFDEKLYYKIHSNI